MSMILFIARRGLLSEITIDVDKDWQAFGITNIRQVAANMVIGNLAQHNGIILERIAPGAPGYVLTSQGTGKKVTWAPAGGSLNYYFPVSMESSHAEVITTPDQSIAESAAFATDHKETCGDAPADNIKQLTPALSAADSATMKASADQSVAKAFGMPSALSILCDGFVEETAAAVQTDKTAQARDAVANDLNLNPMTPAIGDKVYVGSNYVFWQVQVMVGTVGVGNWLDAWYYWNGAAWIAVVNEVDGSNQWLFGAATLCHISHTPQVGWQQCVIQGMNLYWLMCDTVGFVNQITAPLGTQVWVAIA
jgi:hypothetical protein